MGGRALCYDPRPCYAPNIRTDPDNPVNPRPAPAARPRASRHLLPRRAGPRLALLAASALCAACSSSSLPSLERLPGPTDLPFIHKIDVQQGNVVTQEMLAQLQRGMDKKKVTFVMGTPIIQDTFNSNRWDYIYTFRPGGGTTERRRVTLVFVDEKLDHVEGDVKPAEGRLIVDTRQDTTVEVPLWKRRGMMAKLRDSLPFVDPAEPEYEYSLPEDEDAASKGDEAPGGGDDGEEPALGAAGEDEKTVLVPKDAPTNKKKKGFFARFFDGIGLGAGDEADDPEYDPGDPKYRDITNPDDL